MEKEIIDKRAEIVLEAFKLDPQKSDYVDSVKLANLFGFPVYEADLPYTEDGNITLDENGKRILVNRYKRLEEKRFTVAHELSHYFLHYQNDGRMFKHREDIKGKSEEENDADYFAACLLMPKDSFIERYNRLKKAYSEVDCINKLREHYKISPEGIKRRIKEVCG